MLYQGYLYLLSFYVFLYLQPSSKVCDFRQLNKVNEVPVLATFNSVVGTRLLQLNSSAVISAILAYKVDSIDLLLISYTKNNEHFLANVRKST